MYIIRSHDDCLNILNKMELTESFTIFDDSDICMVNGGNTTITKITEDEFSLFSSGQNWSDQKAETYSLKFMIKKLYRNRQTIHAHAQRYEESLMHGY